MITCVKCGTKNEDYYKFCLGCGASLADQGAPSEPEEPTADESCPSCGADVEAGQKFCGNCGHRLDEAGGTSKAAPAEPEAATPKAKPAPAAAKPAASKPPAAQPPAADPPSAGASDAAAVLAMIRPDGSVGAKYGLTTGPNIIGRSTPAEIFSRDPYLSPEHARFEVSGDNIRIVDLDSLNGVFYRITDVTELQHGDMIRIGREVLRFELLELVSPIASGASDGTLLFGSNPSGAWGRLERISSPERSSLVFMLRGKEQKLGRERGDILFRDDGFVSGRHCRIFTDNGRYFVEDLKSSNGTFLRVRGEHTVSTGALLLLGQQPFRVQPPE